MPDTPSAAKTFFGSLCASKIADRNMTAKEVAAKLENTPASQFTRWKKGLWTQIPTPKVQAVAETICPDDYREQADLVIAYLIDMTPLKYRPTIVIGQKGENDGQGLRPMAGAGSGWSEEMQQRLGVLAEAYKLDDEFAAMVDQLVRWGKRLKNEQSAKG